MSTIQHWQRVIRKQWIGEADEPLLAEQLLSHVLKLDIADLFVHYDRLLTQQESETLTELLNRVANKEPLAYILGYAEFLGERFSVDNRALIPRESSEVLVEQVLQQVTASDSILELGVGSGALVLSVAKNGPKDLKTYGIERSSKALQVAIHNREVMQLAQCQLALGDWYQPWNWFQSRGSQHWNLIFSNPPYVDWENDQEFDPMSLRHEPASALFAPQKGLGDLLYLVRRAKAHLFPNGWLILEHGRGQSDAVKRMFVANGYTAVATLQDMCGRPRVTKGKKSE